MFKEGKKREDRLFSHFCLKSDHKPYKDMFGDNFTSEYLNDFAATEAVLLNEFDNQTELWELFRSANKHSLTEFFSCVDISKMLDYMEFELYSTMKLNDYTGLSVNQINDYSLPFVYQPQCERNYIVAIIKNIGCYSRFMDASAGRRSHR